MNKNLTDFAKHVVRANNIVKKWPKWKKDILNSYPSKVKDK